MKTNRVRNNKKADIREKLIEEFRDYVLYSRSASKGTLRVYLAALRRFVDFINSRNGRGGRVPPHTEKELKLAYFEAYKKKLLEAGREMTYVATEISALVIFLEFLRKKRGLKISDLIVSTPSA